MYCLGISKIIGTIVLKVQLHQNLVKKQEFKVVEGLGKPLYWEGPFYLVSKLAKLIGTPCK